MIAMASIDKAPAIERAGTAPPGFRTQL